jgi:hypothetical protein
MTDTANPQKDLTTDLFTPFLQAMLTNQNHNQQQVITNQPKQPQTQPVIITQPTQPTPNLIQPENPAILIPPKLEKPDFTYGDIQNLIDHIHHKQEKGILEPIPQNTPHKRENQTFYGLFTLPIKCNLG